MFEGLLKPKVYKKCKSRVNDIKLRLEMIRKKRNAIQKFLKNDIAELLRSGLDYNAYGRAEGLLVEQNMSSCYELVVNYIGCISDHLQVLCKESNCPDQCKEAVQSLMYAAARFADLPELRDLRTIFTEKFGNSLEPYLSKEFVEKFKREPTREMKIRILHDIAQEFSIEWDSKALEQSLNRSSPLHEERPKLEAVNRKYISSEDSWRLQSSSDDETSRDISSQDGPKTCSSSYGSVSEDEGEYKMPSPREQKHNKGERNSNHDLHEPVVQEKPKPTSVRRRGLKPTLGHDTASASASTSRTDGDTRHRKSDEGGKPIRTTSLPSEEGHMHPNFPDYDDLSARLAAISGR